uniref:histone deacetylase n=1 Tax=Heterorhabditis bacteriophora TaxID=37862 RepID=A0A1I7XR71_HETBA
MSWLDEKMQNRPRVEEKKKSEIQRGMCVDEVMKVSAGQINGFAIVRPPDKYKIERILIIDWDVHHGNGTQEIFFEVVMPTAYELNPELVFISAGFDAAKGDPLGEYQVIILRLQFNTYLYYPYYYCTAMYIFAVHINEVPLSGISSNSKCRICSMSEEPWICLSCFKSKLSCEAYKVNELKALQSRDVQEILNEYFHLQMTKSDVEEERRMYGETIERMQKDNESKERLMNVKVKDLETICTNLVQEKKALESNILSLTRRVNELEEDLYSARNHETPSCLEAVKGEDSDWTIRSESDESTFVIGSSGEAGAVDYLKRIDELEMQLQTTEEQRIKSSSALVAFMSRCRDMEKQLQLANISTNNVSIKMQNREEMLAVVEKIRMDLLGLRKKNTVLREECARIIRDEKQDLSSTESNIKDSLMAETFERSLLLKEDYEKKQLEIMANLDKIVGDLVDDGLFNQSVLDILKEVSESTSNTDNLSSFSAFQGIHIEGKDEQGDNHAIIDNSSIIHKEAADQLSFVSMKVVKMNSSINDIISQSFNTSKEITNVKLGSGSEDSKKVTDHIRNMHLEWAHVFNETGGIINAINDAERSVVDLHGHLSMLEQSLNQSSFIFEASSRFSLENVATKKDAGIDIDEVKKQLEKKIAENTELNNLIEETTKARDIALSTLDNIKKQMKAEELIVSELKMEREHLMEQCEGHKHSEYKIRHALQVNILRENAIKSEQELDKREKTVKQLEIDLSQAVDAKGELTVKVSELQQAVISMRDEMKEDAERRRQEMILRMQRQYCLRTAAALSSELDRANKKAHQNALFTEDLKQCMEREKKHLIEEVQIAKANYCLRLFAILIKMRLIEKENSTMYNALKMWKSKFEELQRQSLNNPDLVDRIARELKDIQSVMGDTKRAAQTLINEKSLPGSKGKKSVKKL